MKKKFSKEAKRAIKLIQNTNRNIFVTGKAGTGKSTLLEYIRSMIDHKIIVLAPTGIAAINVNGDTIHSFFTLKPGYEKDEAKKMKIDKRKQEKFKRIKTIMIDEISMVRADLLDAIDIVLRRACKNTQPFGGVQMIFFGDLYQLPPVVTAADREKFCSEYASPYFFDAEVFSGQQNLFSKKFKLDIIELTKIYRQKDMKFIEVLNAVRDNTVSDKHLEILNKRLDPDFVPSDKEKYIYLMTTNVGAMAINQAKLMSLDAEEVAFEAHQTGKIASNLYPNDTRVTLGVGAQIMFINNDSERRWVNGTIGKVVKISEDQEGAKAVWVEKSNGDIVEAWRHEWEISRYVFNQGKFEREMIGSFTQIPMKLAWAITIHKSQGKTFDKVIVDLGWGTFAHGQAYVALSRCTTLGGLVLKKKLSRSSIIMDQRVRKFAG